MLGAWNDEKRGNGIAGWRAFRGARSRRSSRIEIVGGGGGAGARGRLALFVLLGDGVDAFDELLGLAGALFESGRAERSASWGWAGSGVGGLGSAAVNARREARGKKRQVARSGRETRLEASVDGQRWYSIIWVCMSVAVSCTSVTLALCAAAMADLRANADAARGSREQFWGAGRMSATVNAR